MPKNACYIIHSLQKDKQYEIQPLRPDSSICSCRCLCYVFLYSVTLTEYVAIETEGVCMSVCMYVCLCVEALQPKRLCRFWWNFAQMIWQIFTCVIFFDFWKFKFDDVMAAILHFSYGALSRSQFLSDFLQIWIQVTKLFFTVCYWKSAKSVNKFRRYNGTKNTKFPPRIKFSNLDTKGIILC